MNKILYNVTINIDHNTSEEWLQWMKSTHIPDVNVLILGIKSINQQQ